MIDAAGTDCRLEIDGGVGPANIAEVARAGVDTFVAGSAIFGKRNESDPNHYDTIVSEMRAELAKAKG
jgi:ribulose-phosphate 3-epimerase